ncbi:uncharacterized protein LOC117321990 isoform X4 [Pecten maximus]|nr:uncharacterized protein LOC117321990 isoform X4 [Pecten maximus]
MCANGGIPEQMEGGIDKICGEGMPTCRGGFLCEGSICCPVPLQTDMCPNGGLPELRDGLTVGCITDEHCGGIFQCEEALGLCCPARLFDPGLCPDGGMEETDGGKSKRCGLQEGQEIVSCSSGYVCNAAQYCCPIIIYTGVCPNGGMADVTEFGLPRVCSEVYRCDNSHGMYSCQGGYCCPQAVTFDGPCPNGGMAAQIDGTDKMCDRDGDCESGSYTCTNNYCCPVPVQSGVCPFDGIPDKMETGQPRMCNRTSPCRSRSYKCEEGYCCPRRYSTDGICPGDALPEMMDGAVKTCPNSKMCGGGYSCQHGHCCPIRVFTGICANGGNVSMHNGTMVLCSMEKPCNQSGYRCNRAGFCCPAKVYGGSCPNGGKPAYHDGRPRTCHSNKSCDGGMYICDGGYCCPQRVAFDGPCPNGGMAAQIDGTDKMCDRDGDCESGSYTCTNNYCCPVPVQSGVCPFDGIPEKMETGQPRMCNRTSPCRSRSYRCEGGYCCPRRYSTDGICPGDALPEMMDGAVRTCPNNERCGGGYSCQLGHCCPNRVFTGVCANGGNASMHDGKMVMCSEEKPCNQSGYRCNRAGYCCPAKVYGGSCPNGGKPAYHDGRPRTCYANKSCDGGMYVCDGGYCCPQRVSFGGPCPNGGMAAQIDGTDKMCDRHGDCESGSYKCTNNYCCPVPVQSGVCPFDGIPDKMETGQPRMCNQTSPCRSRSYKCEEGYCCPRRYSTDGICPGDALPEMMDGAVRTCPNNKRCGRSYNCQDGYCCPARIFTGVCANGGIAAMQDGKMVMCSREKPCNQSGYTCRDGYCCPAKVFGGYCPNGGKPAYHDDRPQTCYAEKPCDGGMYICDGGYCCPQRVAFDGPCPNGGMAAQIDGTDKMCDRDGDCESGSYTCTNNYCCPVPVQSGVCPFDGIPDKMETGQPRMCNSTSPCRSRSYKCEEGYCCPRRYSTDGICPGDALPEMMDGAVRTCPNNKMCGRSYNCQDGYCCPARIFTGVCANGGNVAMQDGKMVMCSAEKPCNQSGYRCRDGYCCPAKVFGGYCPNGGKPAYHDDRPQTCHSNKSCDGGMYICDGGYCCPQRVSFGGPCPNGGMAAQIDGTDKMCDRDGDCESGSYTCTNNYCCPVPVQSGVCPFDGIPDKMETGQPRMCNSTSPCRSRSYKCEDGYCCPRRYSTDGICPGDALPEMMDGAVRTCPNNERCGGGYSCQHGHCCPVRVFTGVCANGGNASMHDGKMVMCSAEKPCNQSGYRCNRAGYCCPAKVYGGSCPNGGKPAYHDGRPRTCRANKSCDGGMYVCDGGYCCPQRVSFGGPCPNGGMAAQIDGTDKMCDRDGDCESGSYTCTNNYCCPVPVQSGVCPFDGIPDKMETGQPRMCNRTSPCRSRSYKCEEGYCCPRRYSTDGICPGDALPEMMDGAVRTCPNNERCGGGYSCQHGHCCPVRVFTGVCANGGNASMQDGKMVMCSAEKPCNQSGYRCNKAGYCCPAKVYRGYCPNGGKPAYHDSRPRTCHSNKSCDGGMYICDGGYCCPQRVSFSGFCPYGGIAEQMDRKDRVCYINDTNTCGQSYSCTNHVCCPQVIQDHMNYCPYGGLVQLEAGKPKTCNESGTASQCRARSHSCMEGYCCPHKVIIQGRCPGGAMPEMMGDVPKMCEETSATSQCSSDSFCKNNMCCPKAIPANGPCRNGGDMKMDTNGNPVTCETTKGSCGTAFTCEDVGSNMACCPKTVNISNMQEPCGPGAGPLLSRDGTSALDCEDNTTCPARAFYCHQMAGQSFRLCCPVKYTHPKPGECPVANGTSAICWEQCSNDTDCIGIMKCCSNGCGHICLAPERRRKPGQCPILPTGPVGTCLEECSEDSNCQGKRKCCSNGCGHICLAPDGPCGKDMPLTHMNGTELHCGRGGQACPSDSVCKVDKGDKYAVCCSNKYYEDRKKCMNYHGGYPMHRRDGTVYDCSNGKDCPYKGRCMTDENGTYAVCCNFVGGDDKPCNYFRGGEERKYANGTSLFCGRGNHRVTCPSDTHCTVHPADGFAVCCPKNATKPGTCPAVDEVTTETTADTCADVCTVDTDCEANMKCCHRGCGLTCMKPVIRKPLTECQMSKLKIAISLQTEGDICDSVFIPRCDRNGNYSRTQCQDNTGVCWCVFPNGTEIPRTKRIGRPQCNKASRPGQCPVVTMNTQTVAPTLCAAKCSSDDNCTTAGQRCCESSSCGPTCQAIRGDPEPELCPAGVQAMCCDFLQCVDHMCPAHPRAKCRMNPCGGCHVEFYDKYSNKVNCTEGLTPCQLQRMDANMKKVNVTRRQRIRRYLYLIKQEEEEKEDNTKRPEDTVPMIEETDKMDEVCRLPMTKGSCKAFIYRYYYNHTQQACMKFKYGGCEGNKNNFEDINTCYKTCQASKAVPPFCVPKPKVGDCEAAIPKYYYNTTTEMCEKFYWGGCGKDLTNIFDSMKLCMSKCAPVEVCQMRNCGPEFICQPTGKKQAKCIPKNQVDSGYESYVPRCERDGSFSPQQCIGDTCWCVDSHGTPDNTTISMAHANCNGSSTGGQGPDVVCPDNTRPMVCSNKCQNRTCGDRTDVRCLTNPCQRCQVKFVDYNNKEVKCGVSPCDMREPKMINKPAGGCLNGARRWFFKKSTQTCEVFKYSANCYGKDSYFKSLLDCRNKCQGSPCGETGTLRTCTNTCANMTCQYYPNATCKVNPCTCEAHFFDPVTMELVDCSKFITQCQKNRTNALIAYNENAAAGTAEMNVTLPQCREDGRFSNQQCNETNLTCWCVNQAGQEMPRTRVRVSSPNVDISCKGNNLTHVLVRLRFNTDFSLVRGKEQAFIVVIKAALGPNIAREITDIRLREGSIVAEMTVNGDADPTVVAAEIEEDVQGGNLQMEFEGQTLTADPTSVETSLVFQAQTGNEEDIPIGHRDNSDKSTVIALIITIVVLAAILIVIALFILRKRNQEKNEFSSLEDSKVTGHNNPVYNQAYETK